MLNNMFSSFDSKNFMFFFYILVNLLFLKIISSYSLISKIKIIMIFMNMFMMYNINKKFFFMITFMMIFFLNFFSLNLYMFNLTGHFSLNLIMILNLWIPIMIISFTKKNNKFLTHLLPKGTNSFLIPVMILIEMMSFFIRPLTLLLRLSINMIAGHVLMNLISNNILDSMMIYMFILYLYMIMKFLVSFIQSYIIITLLNLYIEEIYVKYKFFFN